MNRRHADRPAPHPTTSRRIVMQPIEALKPYPNNPRSHTPEQVAKIARSIAEYGWTSPILVDRHNTIIAGHARFEAAKALGLTEVPTIVLEHLTADQARAYTIADNRLALDATWDDSLLRTEIAALRDADYDLSLLGLEDDEIAALLADHDVAPTPWQPDDSDTDPETLDVPEPEPTVRVTITFPGAVWLAKRAEVLALVDKICRTYSAKSKVQE